MKKILFRKLLFDCLIFFTITLFSTGIIIWVFQAVNFLDIIVEDGRNYLVYLNFSILNKSSTPQLIKISFDLDAHGDSVPLLGHIIIEF